MKYIIFVLGLNLFSLTVNCQNQNELLNWFLPKVEYKFIGPVSEIVIYKYNSRKNRKWLLNNSKKNDISSRVVLKYEDGKLVNTLNKTFSKIDTSSDFRIRSRNQEWENNIYYDSFNRVVQIKGIDHLDPENYWFNAKFHYSDDSIVSYEYENVEGISLGYKVLNKDGNVEFSLKKYDDDYLVNRKFYYSGSLLVKEEIYYKGEYSNSREYEYFINGKLKCSKMYGNNDSGTYQENYKYDFDKYEVIEVIGFGPEWKNRKSNIYKVYDELGNLIKEIKGSNKNRVWDVTEYEIKYSK